MYKICVFLRLFHVCGSTSFQVIRLCGCSNFLNLIVTYFMRIWQGQLKLPGGQILALFNKTIRRLHCQLHKAASKDIEAALPRLKEVQSLASHSGRSDAPSSLSRQLIEDFLTEVNLPCS